MTVTDVDLIRAIGEQRSETGTCSYRQLAHRIGTSTSTTMRRVRFLAEQGMVEITGTDGGIRIAGIGGAEALLAEAVAAALDQQDVTDQNGSSAGS